MGVKSRHHSPWYAMRAVFLAPSVLSTVGYGPSIGFMYVGASPPLSWMLITIMNTWQAQR